jgi:hypothetical protein
MTEIDLSKYAAGKRLKCVDASSFAKLTRGKVYESLGVTYEGTRDPNVRIVEDDGEQSNRLVSRFVPVEDEAPEFKAGDRVWVVKSASDRSDWNGRWATLIRIDGIDADVVAEDDAREEATCYPTDILRRPPALSPGHAIREPVRLNEAQREAVGKVDPWRISRLKEFSDEQGASVARDIHKVAMRSEVLDSNASNEAHRPRDLRAVPDVPRACNHDDNDFLGCQHCDPARVWDADKYNGISSAAFQAQSTLDKRIAVAKVDLDDGSRMKAFPHPGRNFALEKWR